MKWIGYHDPTWEPAEYLEHSPHLVRKFHQAHPEKPKPKGFTAAPVTNTSLSPCPPPLYRKVTYTDAITQTPPELMAAHRISQNGPDLVYHCTAAASEAHGLSWNPFAYADPYEMN